MLCDGVTLTTRSGDHGAAMAPLIRVAEAIGALYDAPTHLLVKSLYVDDKNCALYEIDLADEVPDDLASALARNVGELIFRLLGGWNGLIVRHQERTIRQDDPLWIDDEISAEPANDNASRTGSAADRP